MSLHKPNNYDLIIEAKKTGLSLPVYVKFRPLMYEFLEYVSEMFEVIVYCKGNKAYCSPILDAIEEHKKYFAHKLYHNHILFENQKFSVKYYDFCFSDDRSNDNTVIVDKDVGIFSLNMFNGVPIPPYLNNKADIYDVELAYVAQYLEHLKDVPSVNAEISTTLRETLLKQAEFNYSEDDYIEEGNY